MYKQYIEESKRKGTAGHVLYHDFVLKQNITFKELARRMGTSACTVSGIIDNERNITNLMVEKLVTAFPETTVDFWKGLKPNKLRFHNGKPETERYW